MENYTNKDIGKAITISKTEHIWHDYWQDDVIYLSVTSDGRTGKEWFQHFASKHRYALHLVEKVKNVLLSQNFKPTTGVVSKIAVFRGSVFSSLDDRTSKKIREKAKTLGLIEPNAEIACLLREKYSERNLYEAMGFLGVQVMHKPEIYEDDLWVLTIRNDTLTVSPGEDSASWGTGLGYAFVVP